MAVRLVGEKTHFCDGEIEEKCLNYSLNPPTYTLFATRKPSSSFLLSVPKSVQTFLKSECSFLSILDLIAVCVAVRKVNLCVRLTS